MIAIIVKISKNVFDAHIRRAERWSPDKLPCPSASRIRFLNKSLYYYYYFLFLNIVKELPVTNDCS